MSGVHVRDLLIRYGGNPVIQGLDLDVHEGEFLAITITKMVCTPLIYRKANC